MIAFDPKSQKIYFHKDSYTKPGHEIIGSDASKEIIATNLFLCCKVIESFFADKKIISLKINPSSFDLVFPKSESINLQELKNKYDFKKLQNFKIHWRSFNKKQIDFLFWEKEKAFEYKEINLKGMEISTEIFSKMIFENYSTFFHLKTEARQKLRIHVPDLYSQKDSDHRNVNKRFDVFTFHSQAGGGLPFWLNNGEVIKNELKKVIRRLEEKNNFMFVSTSVIAPKKLFEMSGHLEHYKKYMFPALKMENEDFMLRPMTCPQHCLIFNSVNRSYKELPIRMSENSLLFRFESSGSLSGIQRTRQMELKDSHIFVENDPEKIKNEIKNCAQMTQKILKLLEIEIPRVDISTWDSATPDKYHNDAKLWKSSETILENAMSDLNLDTQIIKGEAAFYGPKIDFQISDSAGKLITVSTIQLDFLLPHKFKLKYRTANQNKSKDWEVPVIIHHGLIGTYERIVSVLLEKVSDKLPFWITPYQINFYPFDPSDNDANNSKAQKFCEKIRSFGFRIKSTNQFDPNSFANFAFLDDRFYIQITHFSNEKDTVSFISTFDGNILKDPETVSFNEFINFCNEKAKVSID